MSKIPCGGFELDKNFLGVNENGELSLVGGGETKSHQYLVTDGEGNVQWDNVLAYKDTALSVKIEQKSVTFNTVSATETHSEFKQTVNYLNYFNDMVPELVLTLDGVDYRLKHRDSVCYYGNAHIYTITEEDTGEPVCVFMETNIETFEQYCYVCTTLPGDSHDIAISVLDETIKKIDKEYMPDDMDSIILKSSTSNSAKKFKITVDDSGTITATQV